ncbi:hypothetical protein C347_03779 [Cryptococcus neoformans AD2-60a]|nr:hypothetical protein C347_03779 [Cryptococcus neoformans var. grubii AD2-60a]
MLLKLNKHLYVSLSATMIPLILLLTVRAVVGVDIINYGSGGPGLAWANNLWVPMAGFTGDGTLISSYYNWSPYPDIPTSRHSSLFDVPFTFVPMLWSCNSTYIEPFLEQVANNFSDVILTPQRAILGFNEPDQTGQAECSPEEAAQTWIEVIEPLKSQGYRLGSPAVTSGYSGREWMAQWYEACNGSCNPDFTAVHWYDLVAQNFIEHIQYYHSTYGKNIWVTEFAPQNFSVYNTTTDTYDGQATYVEIQRFMDVATSYMKSVSWVERWFWFGAMYDMQGVNALDTLFVESGKQKRTGALNELGVQYAGSNGSVLLSDHTSWASSKLSEGSYSVQELFIFGLIVMVSVRVLQRI